MRKKQYFFFSKDSRELVEQEQNLASQSDGDTKEELVTYC